MTKLKQSTIHALQWILDCEEFGFGKEWPVNKMPWGDYERAGYLIQRAIDYLKEQPEIVRCKDCKHKGTEECAMYDGHLFRLPDDWFCADGERKEGR